MIPLDHTLANPEFTNPTTPGIDRDLVMLIARGQFPECVDIMTSITCDKATWASFLAAGGIEPATAVKLIEPIPAPLSQRFCHDMLQAHDRWPTIDETITQRAQLNP